MRRHYLLLLVLWCVILVIIDPCGDFPIYDDWAFAQDAKHLAEVGRFAFSDWPAMTLVAQTIWGALFIKVFGFSHDVLRWSVVLLGIGTSMLMYRLAFTLTKDGRRALLASLLVVLNPLFLALTVTYMTEVPFLFLALLSLLCAQRWLARGSTPYFVLACAIGTVAMFVRQHGIVLQLVFGCAFFLRGPKSARRAMAALAPFAIAMFLLLLFGRWKATLAPAVAQYALPWSLPAAVMDGFDRHMVHRAGYSMFLLGLALLPLAAGLYPMLLEHWRRRPGARHWWILVPAAGCMVAAWSQFPNDLILSDAGLGAKLLKDTFHGEHLRWRLPHVSLVVLRSAAFASSLFLLLLVLRRNQDHHRAPSANRTFGMVLGALGGAWTFIILANPLFFDRYTLLLAPIVVLLAIATTRPLPIRWPLVWAVLAGLALPYCLMLRDHFAWNRTRWAALEHLTVQMGVPPSRIDGGFEFNGWHRTGPRRKATTDGISWWFVADDDYVVAAGAIYGFVPVDTFPFRRTVPWGNDTIMILQRQDRTQPTEGVPARHGPRPF